jgi:predicted short-subunit dehydrogenase-like oxidoreductase (DUF2520 family)
LWSKAFDDFEERLGLPRETLQPFLHRTCGNTSAVGREALTGPFSRGDVETIARDLKALDGDGFADVYRAFTSIFGLEEATS